MAALTQDEFVAKAASVYAAMAQRNDTANAQTDAQQKLDAATKVAADAESAFTALLTEFKGDVADSFPV